MDKFHSQPTPLSTLDARPRWRQELIDFLETIAIAAILFLGINAITARIRVDSYSMEPTLFRGDFLIVNKLAFKLSEPKRGDIVVFHYPPQPEQQYIKRVIGLPGDKVRISDGKVFINGEQLVEPYLQVTTKRGGEWIVPENELFVMGDNRNNSADSRVWGTVPYENLIGKAVVIYWPPGDWRYLGMPYAVAAEP